MAIDEEDEWLWLLRSLQPRDFLHIVMDYVALLLLEEVTAVAKGGCVQFPLMCQLCPSWIGKPFSHDLITAMLWGEIKVMFIK